MVGTYSTVEKRAKRMPDTTVKTTKHVFIEKKYISTCLLYTSNYTFIDRLHSSVNARIKTGRAVYIAELRAA